MSAATPPSPLLSRKVARQAVEWYLLEQSGQATPDDLAASAAWRARDPEHARAWSKVQQVGQTASLLPPDLAVPVLRRPQRRVAVQVLLALMAAPAAWLLVRHEMLADYRSGVGERREVSLPDGGTLVLNTDSAVDVAYGADERLLTLRRGEVLIQTRPDHAGSRPFIVATGHGRIRALGTRFSVRVDDDSSRVTVFEHAVEITPRAPSATVRMLMAGQQNRFDASHAGLPAPALPQADAWARGMLAAQDMRLDAFAFELSRYRPGLLRVEPQVAGLRLTGAFQLDDTDAVLENLARILPVDVLYRTAYWVTLAARKK
ncbi:Fe2+-dicitrate sensor protein [Janthinobacterium svalbardensis]|uniref:Fe2+-dicitrate sensor protein n=1 Tax=Janthinobacterium svalbardensis TaxID=368607 RepID=A0A290X180_9BURK|nr:FecR domain-containing protein [Janthinobacterium svalbardensis]ATD62894.1 Fe2+-dicitrate sensor protein [Janthinobacterium svalbardensis]